jgi:hypothetical protein
VELEASIETQKEEFQHTGFYLRELAFVLTPRMKDVVVHGSLEPLAKSANELLEKMVEAKRLEGANYISLDFANESGVVERIIKLNFG